MDITVLGIDLGKNSCSVVGLDAGGRVVLRRRLHREGVVNHVTAFVHETKSYLSDSNVRVVEGDATDRRQESIKDHHA